MYKQCTLLWSLCWAQHIFSMFTYTCFNDIQRKRWHLSTAKKRSHGGHWSFVRGACSRHPHDPWCMHSDWVCLRLPFPKSAALYTEPWKPGNPIEFCECMLWYFRIMFTAFSYHSFTKDCDQVFQLQWNEWKRAAKRAKESVAFPSWWQKHFAIWTKAPGNPAGRRCTIWSTSHLGTALYVPSLDSFVSWRIFLWMLIILGSRFCDEDDVNAALKLLSKGSFEDRRRMGFRYGATLACFCRFLTDVCSFRSESEESISSGVTG